MEWLEDRRLMSVFTVTKTGDTGNGTLRAAVAKANADSSADTIQFAPGLGPITLTSGQLTLSHDVTITGPAAKITIQRRASAPDFRIFQVAQGVTATLDNLAILGGDAAVESGFSLGGAILNHGELTITSTTISGSTARDGGGAILNDGGLTLRSSTISGNVSSGGGAILNFGAMAVDSSTLSGNGYIEGSAGPGGAIYNVGTATIHSSTISGNSAVDGGGVYNDGGGSLDITSSTFSDNVADGISGGAIYNAGTTTIKSSTLNGNSAVYGAGVCNAVGGGLTIASSTLSGNSTDGGFGSSVYNEGVTTINSSTLAGGIDNAAGRASFTLNNSIVAGLSPVIGGLVSGGSNLVQDGSGGLSDSITGDPKLGPLQDNGGPTFTRALLPGSPALNAGNYSLLPPGTLYDQRGSNFPRLVGGRLDIGAFEARPSVLHVGSQKTDGSFGVGSVITLVVRLNEPVFVTGTPTLALNSGGAAVYTSGSGTDSLVFKYTVAAGQNADDLDAASASALTLNGGSIKDALGFNAVRTVPVAPAADSLGANRNIVIDTTAPKVVYVGSPWKNGAYGVGAVITIRVKFNEPVFVAGTPTLALNSGGSAVYASGSGTDLLTFKYTVAAGQHAADLDAASASALKLNGGTIVDEVAVNPNAADLSVPVAPRKKSLGEKKDIVIDTAPKVVYIGSPWKNGIYGVSAVITIRVKFNEPVFVTGTPTLALNSGGSAVYASGSGTDLLTFKYTVAAGQNAADLDAASASALTLNGGTIDDGIGANPQAADLTVPVAPKKGSLGKNKDITIDTAST